MIRQPRLVHKQGQIWGCDKHLRPVDHEEGRIADGLVWGCAQAPKDEGELFHPVTICPNEWCDDPWLQALHNQLVSFFDLSVGLRVCHPHIVYVDPPLVTKIFEHQSGEVGPIISVDVVRDVDAVDEARDEFYCHAGLNSEDDPTNMAICGVGVGHCQQAHTFARRLQILVGGHRQVYQVD